MSYEAVGKLVDCWMSDPQFRATMQKDAEMAVRSTGITLTEQEWKALRAINWDLSDVELKARMNKM